MTRLESNITQQDNTIIGTTTDSIFHDNASIPVLASAPPFDEAVPSAPQFDEAVPSAPQFDEAVAPPRNVSFVTFCRKNADLIKTFIKPFIMTSTITLVLMLLVLGVMKKCLPSCLHLLYQMPLWCILILAVESIMTGALSLFLVITFCIDLHREYKLSQVQGRVGPEENALNEGANDDRERPRVNI